MATATKICKVCGKEYPYCKTERRVAGLFRWQDVACCEEHGNIYLRRVLISRGELVEEPESIPETKEAPAPSEVKATKTPKGKKPKKNTAKNVD